jgi:uroporphyrinogen-III synthase
MQDADISFSEVTTYTTLLNARVQNPEPQGLLFFSPSGVESYLQNNRMERVGVFVLAIQPHRPFVCTQTKSLSPQKQKFI